MKLHLHHFSKIKSQKESQNCKNQGFSYYFCMVIEGSGSGAGSGSGSGSIPLTSGSGSRRPKNRWIRIRNTAENLKFLRSAKYFQEMGNFFGLYTDPVLWIRIWWISNELASWIRDPYNLTKKFEKKVQHFIIYNDLLPYYLTTYFFKNVQIHTLPYNAVPFGIKTILFRTTYSKCRSILE